MQRESGKSEGCLTTGKTIFSSKKELAMAMLMQDQWTHDQQIDDGESDTLLNHHIDKHTYRKMFDLINAFIKELDVEGRVESAKAIKQILISKLKQKTAFTCVEDETTPNYMQKLLYDLQNNPTLILKLANLDKEIADLLANGNPPEFSAAASYYQDAATAICHPIFEHNLDLIRFCAEIYRDKANIHLQMARTGDNSIDELANAEQAFEDALSAYRHCRADIKTQEVLQLFIISIRGELIGLKNKQDIRGYLNIILQIEECYKQFYATPVAGSQNADNNQNLIGLQPHYFQLMLKFYDKVFQLNYENNLPMTPETEINHSDESVAKLIRFTQYCQFLRSHVSDVSTVKTVNEFTQKHFSDINAILEDNIRRHNVLKAIRTCDSIIEYLDNLPTPNLACSAYQDYLSNWICYLNILCQSPDIHAVAPAGQLILILNRARYYFEQHQKILQFNSEEFMLLSETINSLKTHDKPKTVHTIPSAAVILNGGQYTTTNKPQASIVETESTHVSGPVSIARDLRKKNPPSFDLLKELDDVMKGMHENRANKHIAAEQAATKNNFFTNNTVSPSTATAAPNKKHRNAQARTFGSKPDTDRQYTNDILSTPVNRLRKKMLSENGDEFVSFINTSYLAFKDESGLFKHMTSVFKEASTFKKFNIHAVSNYIESVLLKNDSMGLKISPVHLDIVKRLHDEFENELDSASLNAINNNKYLQTKIATPNTDADKKRSDNHTDTTPSPHKSKNTHKKNAPEKLKLKSKANRNHIDAVQERQSIHVEPIKAEKVELPPSISSMRVRTSRQISDKASNIHADDFKHGIKQTDEATLRNLDHDKKIDFADHLFNSGLRASREAALRILGYGAEAGDISCQKKLVELLIRLADISLARVNNILAGKKPLSLDNEAIANYEYEYAEKQLEVASYLKDKLVGEVKSSLIYKLSAQLAYLRKVHAQIQVDKMLKIKATPMSFMQSAAPTDLRWGRLDASLNRDPKSTDPSRGFFDKGTPRDRLNDVVVRRKEKKDSKDASMMGSLANLVKSVLGVKSGRR